MEAYFTVVAKQIPGKKTPNSNSKIYSHPTSSSHESQASSEQAQLSVAGVLSDHTKIRPFSRVSSSNLTNKLLGTLSDPTNPITHSNIADRTDHYVAIASGHQVAENHINQGAYMAYREDKLQIQRETNVCTGDELLKGVKVYINGYLEGTTDIEMKKVVVQCGGQIVGVTSQCTHIITSRGLSGSKTHKILTRKSCKVHVVKPEWVFDSVAYGKRRPERPYAILHTQVQAIRRSEGISF